MTIIFERGKDAINTMIVQHRKAKGPKWFNSYLLVRVSSAP